MSKIEQLIQQLCPEGVEYRRLGEVCECYDGFPFRGRDFVKAGKYPVIKISDIQNQISTIGDTFIDVTPNKLKPNLISIFALHGKFSGSWQ